MPLLLLLILALLLGSIPTGVWMAKVFQLPDPRSFGSGNTGAANLTRLGGKKVGALTFLIDFLKGLIPCAIARFYFPDHDWLAAVVAVVVTSAHCYSFFLGFNGGKGVATAAGALSIQCPYLMLVGLAFWILVFLVTKITSIAALVALLGMQLSLLFFPTPWPEILALVLITLLIFQRHESNLLALLEDKERSF